MALLVAKPSAAALSKVAKPNGDCTAKKHNDFDHPWLPFIQFYPRYE